MIELAWIGLIASLMGLVVPLGIGWLWDAALSRAGVVRPSFGMIYWVGLMSLGAVILLGHAFGLSRALVVWLIVAGSVSGWMWSLLRRGGWTNGELGPAWPLLPLALVGIAYCVTYPVQLWDAYLIWLARVRLLEQWIALSRFRDLQIIYPEYPFLGPAAWWFTEWAAGVPVEAGRVVFLFAYLAFFTAVLSRHESAGASFRLVWAFFAYACFFLQIINGYQDGFLMLSTGMVALAFLQWGDGGVGWVLPLAAGLSLIKAEGAVLGLILVFCWFASQPSRLPGLFRNRGERRTLLLGAGIFCIVLAAWPWLLARNGLDPAHVQGGAFGIQSVGALLDQANRLPRVLSAMARRYVSSPWLTLPFLAAVVSALVTGKHLEPARRFLLASVMVHLLFVLAVFWATQAPFEWHLGTALERLLLQGRLVMLLFIFETATRQWRYEWPRFRQRSPDEVRSPGASPAQRNYS